MQLSGKIIVFVEDKPTDKGVIKVFNTSVSHKQEDGTYVNARINVKFQKENFPRERLEKLQANKCYSFELEEAWLDCRAFTTKEGKDAREIFVSIKSAKPLEAKDLSGKREDLPF